MLYFERSAKSAIKFCFGHGRYLDLWLLVHIIVGVLIGIVGLIFNLSLWQILTLSLFLGFIYEVGESIVRIVEDVENSLIDIVGMGTGTFLSYLFFNFRFTLIVLIFLGFAVFNLLLAYIGWRSYLKRRAHDGISVSRFQRLGNGINHPKLFRDNVFFFGTAAVILPMPFLFHFDPKTAIIWFAFIFLASAYVIYKNQIPKFFVLIF